LLLSSALLPNTRMLIVLLLIVALVTWLLWRSFIRVYSKAQSALQETFTQPPPTRHEHAPVPPLGGLLREADLEMLTLAASSAATGKLIRELQLRSETGAGIVGIERNGNSLVNPGPDEELQSGDQVLLLGTRAQLDKAKASLAPRVSAD